MCKAERQNSDKTTGQRTHSQWQRTKIVMICRSFILGILMRLFSHHQALFTVPKEDIKCTSRFTVIRSGYRCGLNMHVASGAPIHPNTTSQSTSPALALRPQLQPHTSQHTHPAYSDINTTKASKYSIDWSVDMPIGY